MQAREGLEQLPGRFVCMPAMPCSHAVRLNACMQPCSCSPKCHKQEDGCTGEHVSPRLAQALQEQTAPDCSHPKCAHRLWRRAAGRQAVQQQPQPACVAPAGFPAAPAAPPLLHNGGSTQVLLSRSIAPLSWPQHTIIISEPEGALIFWLPQQPPNFCAMRCRLTARERPLMQMAPLLSRMERGLPLLTKNALKEPRTATDT